LPIAFYRSGFPKKNNRLASAQVIALCQVPNLRGGKVWRIAERKVLQRFHLGEMGILDPPRYGAAQGKPFATVSG